VNDWFSGEVTFLIIATIAYALAITYLSLFGNRLEASFKYIIAMFVVIKMLYYLWAFVGAALYFRDVQHEKDSD